MKCKNYFYFVLFYFYKNQVIWKRSCHQKDKEKTARSNLFCIENTISIKYSKQVRAHCIWSVHFKFDLTSTKSFILEEGV